MYGNVICFRSLKCKLEYQKHIWICFIVPTYYMYLLYQLITCIYCTLEYMYNLDGTEGTYFSAPLPSQFRCKLHNIKQYHHGTTRLWTQGTYFRQTRSYPVFYLQPFFYIIHSCYVVSFHYSSISEIIKYYLMHRNISTAKLNISINTPLVIEQREIWLMNSIMS